MPQAIITSKKEKECSSGKPEVIVAWLHTSNHQQQVGERKQEEPK
jgi:hypothetical protein